jgi:polysaccharide export outer membrane protein
METQRIISRLAAVCLAGLMLAGCQSPGEYYGGTASVPGPAPSLGGAGTGGSGDMLRPGDLVSLTLSGVPQGEEFRSESRVSDDGTVTMPRLPPMRAAGLSTDQVQAEIEGAYRGRGIYTSPTVLVVPLNRWVNVGGEVRQPNRIQYSNDLTVLRAIYAAGGFTEYANKRAVRVLRGGRVVLIDARRAEADPRLDMPLQAGDVVVVTRSIL